MNKKHLVLLIIFLVISGKSYAQNSWHSFGIGDKYLVIAGDDCPDYEVETTFQVTVTH